MSDTVIEQTITSEDKAKLDDLKDVPTVLDNLFLPGSEGKTLFDGLVILVGGQTNDRKGILQRTELTAKEVDIVSDALQTAKYGLMADGKTPHPIPELEERVLTLLEARRSLNRKSTEEFTDGLQKIKLKLSEIQNPIKSV